MHSQWFETFFQGVAVEFWSRVIPAEMTAAEVDFLVKALELQPGARVLDVPCGHGRHSLELARFGYRVTGLDISEDALGLAKAQPSTVEWVQGDMHRLDREAEFDAAFCFGNSFAYVDQPAAAEFLRAVARALKPGGRLAIETGMAAESILPTLQPRFWFRVGDILMLSERRYVAEDSRLDIDYTFVQNGVSDTRSTASYVFTVAEHKRMLEQAGMEVVSLLGSTAGEPYKLGSPRLIMTARKR